ncbi:MAG: ABC transporter ATP-binding protein [Oceanococcus sp.]
MTLLLTAHKLSRRFGSQQAVADFSLEIRRGEVIGLLGPNGAGKTTSLRMLSGCLSPDQGHVQINGVDLHRQPLAAKAQLGYLPEKPPLHLELRVDEFLLFAARLRGLNAKQARQSLQRTCEACGLEAVRKRIIGSLSKGYRQRVGLAQALIHNPALIILDEPTDGLDPQQLQQVRQLIRNLASDHAVLLSSHLLSEVQAVCDRLALMSRGKLVKQLSMHALGAGEADNSRPLLLQLRSEQACEGLLALEGVQAAEQLRPGHYRLQLDNLDARESISRLAAQQDWGLLEMHTEPLSLESIFAELRT